MNELEHSFTSLSKRSELTVPAIAVVVNEFILYIIQALQVNTWKQFEVWKVNLVFPLCIFSTESRTTDYAQTGASKYSQA